MRFGDLKNWVSGGMSAVMIFALCITSAFNDLNLQKDVYKRQVPGCRGGSALLGSRGNAHWRVEGSQPHRVKGETPCPGKVDACVNLYWVLPDAKFRRFGGFAALPSPEQLCRKEEKCLKLTRHNGRSGKHGTYNPRHNDRRFDVENSEHIDAERARQNVYWDCYREMCIRDRIFRGSGAGGRY